MRKRLLSLLLIISIFSILPSMMILIDPLRTKPTQQLLPPNHMYLLGTDYLGRDVFSRLVHGGQRTIMVALVATLVAMLFGGLLGSITLLRVPSLEIITTQIINAALAFPSFVIALIVLTILGRGFIPLAIAVGIAQIAPFARMTHFSILSVRSKEYVQASHALGAGNWHIYIRHILPSIRPTLFAYVGIVFSYSILNSAALSFLGLGGEPGIPDWGVMLAEGRNTFRIAPWNALAPGLAITITVTYINWFVDQWNKPLSGKDHLH